MLKINEVLNVEGTLFRILTILPHSIIWIDINLRLTHEVQYQMRGEKKT